MKRFMRNTLSLSLCLSMMFFFNSCQKENLNEETAFDAKAKVKNTNEDENDGEGDEGTDESATFPSFHQGFNNSLAPWGDATTGNDDDDTGWCGDIELKSKKDGDIKPSAGAGYATVEFGACNTFWTGAGFPDGSAPATLDPSLFSQVWPDSGFIHQLDIYLDPSDFEEGNAFSLFFGLYYDFYDYPFDYYAINVSKDGGSLVINGDFEVADAGWYTFKQSYNQTTEGDLTAEFVLQKNHHTVYMTELETTVMGNTDLNINKIHANGDVIGSGYMWFPFIAPGVELAIDEYQLRPGK